MFYKMSHTVVRQCAKHPPANDFADNLENIFHGDPGSRTRPLQLTQQNWSPQELKGATERMKTNKASDEFGLVAELLQMLLDPAFLSATMLFFRLGMFQRFFQAPEDQGCKCFVHESDISNGTEVLGGSCVLRFGSVWNTLHSARTMALPPWAVFRSNIVSQQTLVDF